MLVFNVQAKLPRTNRISGAGVAKKYSCRKHLPYHMLLKYVFMCTVFTASFSSCVQSGAQGCQLQANG
jgi:hypothetical protein